FGEVSLPSTTPPQTSRRQMLSAAQDLMKRAGWRIEGSALIDGAGKTAEGEILVPDYGMAERIALWLSAEAVQIGIKATVRRMEDARFAERKHAGEYDMIFERVRLDSVLFNGFENAWGSASVGRAGTQNYSAIASLAVDELIAAAR